ncbi:MAG: ribose-phosphate diphosphokinase [Oscillospiraceae bacterium]|jgi:ribose-phosphate pyrophosphokinase|nr:ribose-phosphate diphosphokinase [Oscillospiraceae bacterium]
MRNDNGIKIFAGTASREFARKICGHLAVPLGESQVITFSEGNTYVKIGEKVRGNDVYIVQTIGIDPNNEFMELLFWIDAFNRASVNSVTVIMPYFSYAKADKKDEPRVSIRARVCADCLEAVGVSRVVTMDLHSPQIQGFFRKPVDHLYAANIFCDYIKALELGDYVIVSPDEGFAKNAGYFSHKLNVPLAVGNKRRSAHDEKAEILNLFGDVSGKTAVIVDDLAISCGTLKEIAAALKKNGAGRIIAFVSHSPISDKGVEALTDSEIETLYTTDTIYNPKVLSCPKIEIISVSELFAKTIKIIHEKDSLGELFL